MQDIPPPPDARADTRGQPHRIPAWALAGILSLIVLALWAAYIRWAPAPETPAVDGAPAETAAQMPAAQVPAAQDSPPGAAGALHVLVWRHLINPDVLAGFEAESGLKVVADSYDTNEQLAALIDGGHFAADLAVVSGVGMKRLVAGNLLAPLPPLAAATGLDPAITARAGVYDPGNLHSAVVLWGTLGLAFDAPKVADRLGETVVDSWNLLFDADTMAKLASCGVQVVDSPVGAFPIALIHLGHAPDSSSVEDTAAASQAWEAVRPSIGKFANAGIVDALAEGKVCLALATSGDAYQAHVKALASGGAADIHYALPKEGTVVWYAMLGVSKTAANPSGAAKLADYLLRPDVAARLSNAQGLANAVPASAPALRPELKDDQSYLPPSAAFAAFTPELEPSPAAAALRNRFWQLINTPPATTTP